MEDAYKVWMSEVASRVQSITDNFANEILLAFMFPQFLEGLQDGRFPNAIKFPSKNIPDKWIKLAEAGAIRLENLGDYVRLWKPYYFLLRYMKEKATVFDFIDINQIQSEIDSAMIAPDKRKEYYFQRAGKNKIGC